MINWSAKDAILRCPVCNWDGTEWDSSAIELNEAEHIELPIGCNECGAEWIAVLTPTLVSSISITPKEGME